jgi:hypothetical protein
MLALFAGRSTPNRATHPMLPPVAFRAVAIDHISSGEHDFASFFELRRSEGLFD